MAFLPRKARIPTIEFLKDRIYLAAYDNTPIDTDSTVHFTIDDALPYNAFHHDFGPLHVGHLYRFAVALHEILGDPDNEGKVIFLYSRTNPRDRANTACLLCCYMVLIQSWPPHLALAPIAQAEPPYMPFRDAGYSQADFILTIQDIVYGVWQAKEKKLLDLKTFNLADYERYERVDQGDFNEIYPFFVAFASPQQEESDYGKRIDQPFSNVLDYFNDHDVQCVVRLNSHLYDKTEFENRNIKHIDMIFDDGSCPTMDIVKNFLGVVEGVKSQGGKVAVHCKAGLGRTGCLIGAHLIYTYGFTASEVISYMRFLRPGMVVGPQQHWLYLHQNEFRDWKRTMMVSEISDPSLAGYSSLVPYHSQQAGLVPHTPEKFRLNEQQNHGAVLPVPTPGQPRKNSPSPGNKVRAEAVTPHRTSPKKFIPVEANGHDDDSYSTSGGYRDAPGVASDEEDDGSFMVGDSLRQQQMQQTKIRSLSSKQRISSEHLPEHQQILLASKRRGGNNNPNITSDSRSITNPGQRVRSSKNMNFQMTTTTTTTTTTTLSSSPPPHGYISPNNDEGSLQVKKTSRVVSYGERGAMSNGIRKVSASMKRKV